MCDKYSPNLNDSFVNQQTADNVFCIPSQNIIKICSNILTIQFQTEFSRVNYDVMSEIIFTEVFQEKEITY